jgi:hypothetical protein
MRTIEDNEETKKLIQQHQRYFDELFLYLKRTMLLDFRIMKLKMKYILMEGFFPWKALWTRKRFNRIIRELERMKTIWPINMTAHAKKGEETI